MFVVRDMDGSISAFKLDDIGDIRATRETKVQAMAFYESEARRRPHPRSAEALRASARRWGRVVGLGAAEAFEPIRVTR